MQRRSGELKVVQRRLRQRRQSGFCTELAEGYFRTMRAFASASPADKYKRSKQGRAVSHDIN